MIKKKKEEEEEEKVEKVESYFPFLFPFFSKLLELITTSNQLKKDNWLYIRVCGCVCMDVCECVCVYKYIYIFKCSIN